MDHTGYSSIAAAGPFFFFSSWLLMLFAGIVGDEVGVAAFGYLDAMKATIGLWLVVAPLVGAISTSRRRK